MYVSNHLIGGQTCYVTRIFSLLFESSIPEKHVDMKKLKQIRVLHYMQHLTNV